MKHLLLISVVILPLAAQDFGYTYYNIIDYRSLGISYNIQEFSPVFSDKVADSVRIKFSSNLPSVEYRQLNARVAIGYQEYRLGNKLLTSFSVYMESISDFSISGKEQQNGFFIPLRLSANYVKAENPYQGNRNFDIGSLGIGSGIKYRFITRDIGVQIIGTWTIHFSNVGFGTEYGSQTAVAGEVQVIFPELLYDGMIVGYRYERQRWNMNDPILDYKRFYHGPFIGLFF